VNSESTSGFISSCTSIHTHKRRPNCSWGPFGSGEGKRTKTGKIGADLDDRATTNREMGIRRAPVESPRRVRLSITPKRHSNYSWGRFGQEGKKTSKIAKMGADLGDSTAASTDMGILRVPVASAH
jgi:hypothetical protein